MRAHVHTLSQCLGHNLPTPGTYPRFATLEAGLTSLTTNGKFPTVSIAPEWVRK